MKNSLVMCLIIAVMLIVTPLISLTGNVHSPDSPSESEAPETQTAEKTEIEDDTITVFRHLSGTVEEMELVNYAIGAVAGEMPAVYGEQALMAQAAVSLNIARIEKEHGGKTELEGAVISDDSASHQCCMSEEQMKEKWGDKYDVYYNKIKEAVNAVYDYRIMYAEKLASTVFHAVSCGKTESAKNVWGNDVSYLQAVDSSWDSKKSDFESNLTLPAEAFSALLSEKLSITTVGEPKDWVSGCEYSPSGTLIRADICGKSVTGTLLRSCLSLKSAAIKLQYDDGSFVFTVHGYGHGVGMSQYGASRMAENGSTWQEIIEHYYPGIEIEKKS